jgi:hypothetical protein
MRLSRLDLQSATILIDILVENVKSPNQDRVRIGTLTHKTVEKYLGNG